MADKTLLRLVTSGSVDDGKSTLIGRLLYETGNVTDNDILNIKRISQKRGLDFIDYSLLLDGLSSEREQGITIDVAYRYFETENRKFIIADTPGHEQYTRNMVTGASGADLAIILIDAQKGISEQSKRHGIILSLLQIPHLVVVVNKMDLVDYSKDVFDKIVKEYSGFSEKLEITDIRFVPVSALTGENVVNRGKYMNWYKGQTVLDLLTNINVGAHKNLIDFRFPVQYVIKGENRFRSFAGRVESGIIRKGEKVVVLPHDISTAIVSIYRGNSEISEATSGESISIVLDKDVDISRGDMIVRPLNKPFVSSEFDALICWLDNKNLSIEKEYIIKHTTKETRAYVSDVFYRINVNTLHREKCDYLNLNDIGRVEFTLTSDIYFDFYKTNRNCGSFILIDPLTNKTVAAGMIKGLKQQEKIGKSKLTRSVSSNVVWYENEISREEWEKINKHKSAVLWFTGLSGSGKSTIAGGLARYLFNNNIRVMLLDGDKVRHGLCGDLGFSIEDRKENIRRIAEVAKLFYDQGNIVICTFISPFRESREFARKLIDKGRFIEIFINCDISVCKKRDPKGLYKKAEQGIIKDFTGISSPYEKPLKPEIELESDILSVEQSVKKILDYLKNMNLI